MIAEVWVGDRISNSSKINLTTTVLNTAPIITNPQTIVIQNTSSSYIYDYNFTDLDGDNVTWSDNTTLFNINSSTGVISDTPTETETGNYTILITASDGTNSDTDTFEYVIKDTTKPNVIIDSPINSTYNSSTIIFNLTVTDNVEVSSCWFNLNDNDNISMTNASNIYTYTNSSIKDGQYIANFFCNDTSGNLNNTENVTFTIDTTAPNINTLFPTNIIYNVTQTQLNYTVSDLHLDSCWYSIDLGVTNNSITCGTNITGLTSSEGSNTWIVYVNDTVGNINSSSVTFTIDTTAPKLNIVSPLNITYLNTSLILNYTSSDINLDTTWYEYNGTNKTLTGNTTFTALDNQQSTLTLWANDSVGNINSSSVTFTINTLPPTITIIQPTTADMNIHNPTLSVSLNLPGSCKYNIDNGANISMGSGTFLNSEIGRASCRERV